MKKIIPIVLAIILLIAFPGTMLASEDSQDRAPGGDIGLRYTLIDTVTISFSISNAGLASMKAKLYGNDGVDRVRISAYLQKDDGGWTTVQHYSAQSYSDYVSWSATKYVMSGYNYRLRVFYYAYDGAASESTSLTAYDSY